MIGTIITVLSETIPALLSLKKKETKSEKVCKELFGLYQNLGSVIDGFRVLEYALSELLIQELQDPIIVKEVYAGLPMEAFFKDPDNHPFTKRFYNKKNRQTSFEGKGYYISVLLECINDIEEPMDCIKGIMSDETKNVWRKDHNSIEKLGVFDRKVYDTMMSAWWFDGGFIELLRGWISLNIDIGNKKLNYRDYSYSPDAFKDICDYDYGIEKHFSIEYNNPDGMQRLIKEVSEGIVVVISARDEVSRFIKENFKIEDIF